MPATERTEIFDVDQEKFFNVVTDYASYPEFVEGVDEIEVIDQGDDVAKVKYSINLIKKFTYTLIIKQEHPNRVTWELESGDLFKENTGFWEIEDLGDNQIKVTYSLDLKFKMMVPKMVISKLVSKNLPAMMQSYYERAKLLQ